MSALVHQGHNVSTFCTFHEKNGGICDIVPLNDGQAIIQWIKRLINVTDGHVLKERRLSFLLIKLK